MATINDLPTEILRRILELMREESAFYSSGTTKGYYADYCSASLVSKRFQLEAQALLWRTIKLSRASQLTQLVKSKGCARYTTKWLRLSNADGNKKDERVTHQLIARALKVLHGVQHFSVSDVNGHTGGLLFHPSLKDLVHFSFQDSAKWTQNKLGQLSAPSYHLKSLVLNGIDIDETDDETTSMIQFIRPVFVACTQSLRRLVIGSYSGDEMIPVLIDVLPLVLGTLEYLSLPFWSSEVMSLVHDQGRRLSSIYLNNLIHTTVKDFPTIMQALPTQLASLTLELDLTWAAKDGAVATLGLPNESFLKSLRLIAGDYLCSLRMVDGLMIMPEKQVPQSIVDECNRKGIELEVHGLED